MTKRNDTADRSVDHTDEMRRNSGDTPHGPLGDARPDKLSKKKPVEGGQPPEKVEDRPNVSTVTPEDYPSQQ